MSHYNARKRVYTRRQISRQLAQKLRIEKWTKRYTTLRREKSERWMWMRGPAIHYKEDLPFAAWKDVTLTEPSHASWFDTEGYPLTSRDPETGRFVNPWLSESSNGENGLSNFLRWKVGGAWSRFIDAFNSTSSNNLGTSQDGIAEASERNTQLVTNPNICQYQTLATVEEDQITNHDETIRLTWIGHSTTLVTFPGNFTILTDPHFHNYAGPVRRTIPPALSVADLPEIVDCVLISHDHMDHLNYWSILELIDSNKVTFWIVPLGVKSWLMDKAGIYPENIVELEWWQSVRLSKRVGGKYSNVVELSRAYDRVTGKCMERKRPPAADHDKDELLITCAPAQHWCSRTPFDRNTRLWCSFAVHATPALAAEPLRRQRVPQHIHSFYFAGDTGLPTNFPLHHQIGDRLGPFDLSAIPIGAYKPEWFMRESHCTPAEAVKIHQAIRSKRSVAIHYDTFDLADEPRDEPPKLLLSEVDRVNDDILRVAADVVEVADGIGITATQLLEKNAGVSPPLVDFAIIKHGHSIESLKHLMECNQQSC
jgi:N-acyl-phosphatidylethanolamine-hydrolysing phospholipase D